MRSMLAAMIVLCAAPIAGAPPRLPSGPLPDGLGVNIHFTTPQPGEMKMLADGGFTWVRMDFDWNQVEYERGRYRFDAYDVLMKALEEHRIRPIFILDYVHRLYDNAQSPHTDEAIAAFARFAAAAAKHYEGRGVLWEMYNEPNITPFWRPTVNVQDYIRLATATGKAIRAAAPKEAYIGPATSTIDWRFLEECFRGGLLELWDAVSVHPYRPTPPETVIPEYARLRALIRRYAPKGKRIPIISGEWGYSAAWGGMDADKQGKMLPRQWLTNIACGVPLSIWYDWHDDGPDPKEPEHHFGTVLHPYLKDRTPVYDPKPAYIAARTLASVLRGFRFDKRLVVGPPENRVLLFKRGREVRVAAWTTLAGGNEIVLPASPGTLRLTDHLGKSLPPVTAAGPGARLRLADAPVYIVPEGRNRALEAAGAWEALPPEIVTAYRRTLTVQARLPAWAGGPRTASKTAALSRSAEPIETQLALKMDQCAPIVQATHVVVSNPLVVEMEPPIGGRAQITVENPAGAPFSGAVEVGFDGSAGTSRRAPLRFRSGQTLERLSVPAPAMPPTGLSIAVRILDSQSVTVLSIPRARYVPVAGFGDFASGKTPQAFTILADGDPRVVSSQALVPGLPSDGPPAPGVSAVRLTYRFEQGWKFVRVTTQDSRLLPIEGRPRALGMWIHGDGKGNIPRIRFVDRSGQTWQPDGSPIVWTGWKWFVFPLDGTRSGRWGGADDGVIHYPIRWDSLFLLDSAGARATEGEIHFAAPTLIY